MAGRPPLPIGAHGKITTKEIRARVWQARCRYRDADGVTRPVKRQGRSSAAAANALRAALAERGRPGTAELGGDTRVSEAGARWLQLRAIEVEEGSKSPRTLETYASAWRLHVEPGLGMLRLREVTTWRCEVWLTELRRRVGPSMCQTARSVLSGVLGWAARMDAIDTNPCGGLSPIRGGRKRQPRAMTLDERTRWLAWLDTHVARDPALPRRDKVPSHPPEVIASRALGDVTRLMLATGCRIGELMAISWDEVDLDAGTVAVCWHLVRVKGEGVVRLPGAKSEAGERVLRLPSWATAMLLRRRTDPRSGYPIFPDALGGWRDPNLVMRWLRWSRDEIGLGWVTSHVFRQTVITVLDEAGLSTREVADQAGHSKITQTQDYMARGVASDRAAAVLEGLL